MNIIFYENVYVCRSFLLMIKVFVGTKKGTKVLRRKQIFLFIFFKFFFFMIKKFSLERKQALAFLCFFFCLIKWIII